jgi:hypothetical protein
MRGTCTAAIVVLIGAVSWAQRAEPIRRGWNAFNGVPYNSCSWLVVTGPAAARQKIIEQAKQKYSEADPSRLASVQNKVFVEILTVAERQKGCSNRTFTEVIFVDKDTDKPVLRLPVESREIALSNGFGANWNANDGVAVANFEEFTTTLRGKYHVVVVYADGGTARIGQGAGQTVWSANETSKVQ